MSFRTDAVPTEVVQLLSRCAGILELLPKAYLAGGTALSLYFAHRVSVDLDFFVPQSFLAEDLRPRLIEAGRFSPITVRNDSIVCRVDAVQWSLFRYEYPLLESPEHHDGIRIASVRDIAAMKVVAIGDRGSRKDFYDLYTILHVGGLDIRKILGDMVSKFRLPQDNVYHYIRALTYFDDAVRTPDFREMLRIDVRWPDVELFFRNLAKELVA